MTIDEAASLLRRSKRSIRGYVSTGRLVVVRPLGDRGHPLVPSAVLIDLLVEGTT